MLAFLSILAQEKTTRRRQQNSACTWDKIPRIFTILHFRVPIDSAWRKSDTKTTTTFCLHLGEMPRIFTILHFRVSIDSSPRKNDTKTTTQFRYIWDKCFKFSHASMLAFLSILAQEKTTRKRRPNFACIWDKYLEFSQS